MTELSIDSVSLLKRHSSRSMADGAHHVSKLKKGSFCGD